MNRIEWLFGFALLALIGLAVAYYFLPKDDDGQGQAPLLKLSSLPTTPAQLSPEQLRASSDELTQAVKKLGGSCGALWEPKLDEAWYRISLPAKTTDDDLNQLPRIDFECWLSLSGTKITDVGLATLKSQPKLFTLDLSYTKITGKGLKELAESENLVELQLGNTAVRDADLEHLTGFKRLRSLHLNHTQITDSGLKIMQRAVSLRKLNINYTSISREGLWQLREFPSLECLDVSGLDWLTVSDMSTIGTLDKLEKLHIGFSPVTDEGLVQLSHLRHLESLTLLRTHVTDDGVKRLQKALPKCKIRSSVSVPIQAR